MAAGAYSWERSVGRTAYPGAVARYSTAWSLRWWILMATVSSIILHAGLFYLLRDLNLGDAGVLADPEAPLKDTRFEDQIAIDPKLLEQTLAATTPELTDAKTPETEITKELPPIDQIVEHLKGDITLSPETKVPLNIEFKAPKKGEPGSSTEVISAVDSAIAGGVDKKIRSSTASDILTTAQAQDDQVTIKLSDKAPTGADAMKNDLAAARKRGEEGLKGLGFSSLDDLMNLKTPQTGDLKAMIPSRTLFDYDSTVLRSDAKIELVKLGFLLQTWTKAQFHVEGHTDTTGDEGYNMDLSRRRAEAVKEWVVNSLKINGDRIHCHGFGESQPLANPNGTQEQQELNRRVVIRIVNH